MLLLLLACTDEPLPDAGTTTGPLTSDAFLDAYDERYCEELERCSTYRCVGATVPDPPMPAYDSYDPVAAAACLDGEWTCDPETTLPVPPPVCGEVYLGLTNPDFTTIDPYVGSWMVNCYPAGQIEAILYTAGWTNGAVVWDLWDTRDGGGWSEEHLILSTERDEDGVRERHELLLTEVEDPAAVGDHGDGTGATLFDCREASDLYPQLLTFAHRVYAPDGRLTECTAFGHRPEVVGDGTYPTGGGLPSAPEELVGCPTR